MHRKAQLHNELKATTFDLIQRSLTDNPERPTVKLTTEQSQIRERWLSAYHFWVNNPILQDSEVVNYLVNDFKMSRRAAYYDLGFVKRMLGNVTLAHKAWHRHEVIVMAKETYNLSKTLEDPAGMAAAARLIIQCMQLDKTESDDLPWDQMIPPNFEPSTDITVLGFTPDPNIEQRRRAMREKYLKKFDPEYAVTVEIE